MGTLKNTNTKAFKAQVFRCILDSVSDECGEDDKQRAAYIWQRFNAEHNYTDNRKRFPNLQARVANWLSGVALNIPYANHDIVQTCERWHETTLTDKQADMVIANWFGFMAFKLMQCVQSHGVDINEDY